MMIAKFATNLREGHGVGLGSSRSESKRKIRKPPATFKRNQKSISVELPAASKKEGKGDPIGGVNKQKNGM